MIIFNVGLAIALYALYALDQAISWQATALL